jgi:DNA-binding NtrC family response regulator
MGLTLQVDRYLPPSGKSCESGNTADENSPRQAHQDADLSSADNVQRNKGCILLVDDDNAVRETLAELLEDVGFRPLQAGDAAEALIVLRQDGAIDALVTDLTMPGDDGIALIRQARTIRDDLPAILLTGYAEEVTAINTIAGGNYHVLRKPVESGRLIQQLELLVVKSTT